jgi:hypothetical protein
VRYLKEAHQIGQSKQSHLLKAAYNTERCVLGARSLDAFAWSVLFWSVRCQHHALLLQLGFFFGECSVFGIRWSKSCGANKHLSVAAAESSSFI